MRSALGSNGGHLSTVRLRDLAAAGRHHDVLSLFRQALRHPDPLLPIDSVLPSALLSAAALSLPPVAAQLHSLGLKSGLLPADAYVLTALITVYSRLRLLPLACRLLDDVPSATAPTSAFNALISGHALAFFPSPAAISLFCRMRRDDVPFDDVTILALLPAAPLVAIPSLHGIAFRASLVDVPSVSNCLISCYSRFGAVDIARQLFDEMPDSRKDLVSWNAMISCYAQNGLAHQVLELYDTMEHSPSVEPDAVTLIGVLSSCAYLGAHSIGKEVEDYINQKASFDSNTYLKNALINLHAKCGDLDRARKIFDQIPQRTIVSWTAMIAGYGMHGQGEEALRLFDMMIAEGVKPDGIAMVSVLSACSHVGMVDKGMKYFSSMKTIFCLVPNREHYACMVDLLGRAGRLKEAGDLIMSMPMDPDAPIWGALLGACKIHKNVELAELAFEHVSKLEPTNVGYYVLMSNIYSDAGRLDGVARIRAIMRERRLKKDPGCSYVDYKGKVHLFLADDHSHPQAKKIYEMIARLEALVKNDSNITGNTRAENVPLTGFHSEKLAIAFGLLNTEAGVDIVVIKNLRVCEDCHQFMKMVSRVVNRKFVVRDASRFHHFEGGTCSCKDYW
ncbi:pentatricopeptide repeat-containing protein [Canna indica]|uniref:Pentatricopeptide repeat-containing protein n=1 Tax=Canna indica TaxID=4628 RepID=A0AAQ3K176_9LILI|nr:pentatricopeptide repeat-containing protein [Canna indica]